MSFIFGQMLIKNGDIFQIVDSVYNEDRGSFEYILSDINTGKVIAIGSNGLYEYTYLTPTLLVINPDLRRRLIGSLKNATELDFLIDREVDKKTKSLNKKYKKNVSMGFKK